MSVKTRIHDGLGSGRTANVTPQNALLVQVLPETSKGVPPADLSNLRFLQEFFLDSLGSSDQRVNGSVTPVEFFVAAGAGVTKWITSFKMIIESNSFELATANFRDYGATLNPGLPNGIQIEAFQGGTTTAIAPEPIRIAGDYLQYADSFTNFVNAITAQADYLQVNFTFETPIVLTAGSTDRITIRIRDNLTAALTAAPVTAARQYALARGYQEFV